jgi:hypothetical protein
MTPVVIYSNAGLQKSNILSENKNKSGIYILNPIGIAQWFMGDGYFGDNTLRLCTDNFTKEEVLILLDVLDKKFGIKATLNKRSKDNGGVC